jgi:hypothetical protein
MLSSAKVFDAYKRIFFKWKIQEFRYYERQNGQKHGKISFNFPLLFERKTTYS